MAFWGINEDNSLRNTSRVLKPPGGGSSDIFGSDCADGRLPRRNVRSHEASVGQVLQQVGDSSSGTPSKRRDDSHLRLFGPAPNSQQTPSKNRLKSNIPIGENGVPAVNGHTENGHVNGDTTDGNPVTGNGYVENGVNGIKGNGMENGINGMNGHGNGIGNGHGNGNGNGHGNGNGNGHGRRVPPGGFSSGLW